MRPYRHILTDRLTLQLRNDFSSSNLNIGSAEKVGDDYDSLSACLLDFGKVVALDSADAEDGDLATDFFLNDGDVFEADSGTTDLGGSWKKRTEADVVRTLRQGCAGLLGRVLSLIHI